MADFSPTPLSRLYAGPFPALEERLLAGFPGRAGRTPGGEHVLLVPSNELSEHLLKRLAAAGDGAFAGASAMTLYDFALRLLSHRGKFPSELPPVRMAAAVLAAAREVYASGQGDFSGIAATPGFVPALTRTLSDLEEGWVGDAELAASESAARGRGDARKAARWAEWRRLRAAVERKVRAMGGMTRRRIFQEAVAGFEQPGYPFRVTLYGFYDFTRLQWILVDRLLSSGLLEEVYFPGIFGPSGDLSPAFLYAAKAWDRLRAAFEGNAEILADSPEADVAAARARIFSPAPPPEPIPAPFPVLSAPHAEGEMRLAARRVRRWQDEAPEAPVFLTARNVSPEAMADWERIFAEYGIRTAGRLDVPLSSVPPVRLLLRMMEVARDDFPRRKVVEVLSSSYRRLAADGGGTAPRPDLWDLLSRELMVVSGGDWETRLSRLPRGRRAEEGNGEEGEEERREQLALLSREVRALRASFRPLLAAKGYAAFARAVRDLLVREFRVVRDGTPEGERDRRAVETLFSLIDDLEGIPDAEVPWRGVRECMEWFASLLSSQRLFVGERGGMRTSGAVVFGDAIAMRGVTGDRALILSVNEDAVPAQLEEDPLLPDEDREEINRGVRRADLPDALSLRRRNAAEEKLLFSLPIASVRKGFAFSVLRADANGAGKRPSRYLLHLLSRFAGPQVFSEDWEAASGAVVERLPRSPFGILSGEGPRSARECALSAWRGGQAPPGIPGIPWGRIRGILASWAERSAGAGIFPGPGVRVRIPATHSASALEELARCPYRYFLRFLLSLEPPEEPEEALSLTPADMGVLAHDMLRHLGRDASEGKGWGDTSPAARRAVARFARENPTGLPGLFRIQCGGVERDVARVVAWERAREEERPGWRIAGVESPFSLPATPHLPALHGRVDRIDRGPAGEGRVVDYKYRDPKRGGTPPDWIRHGLSHQLPVYLAWAATLAPAPPAVSAAFYFFRNGFGVEDAPPWEEVRGEWAEAVAGWLSLAAAGIFPPLPHHRFTYAGQTAPRYCDACPYRDHCRVSPAFDGSEADAAAVAERVSREPALRTVAVHRPGKG
jgi:RecB family exonuclease